MTETVVESAAPVVAIAEISTAPQIQDDEEENKVNYDVKDRAIRQRDIVPPNVLKEIRAVVIGTGAIGRQAAMQLACLGVTELLLFDDDKVSAENLAPQGFHPVDLGKSKVDCVKEMCQDINPDMKVTTHSRRYGISDSTGLKQNDRTVFFCCVDNIDTRGLIWRSLSGGLGLFVDARMAAEIVRILTADLVLDGPHDKRAPYYSTLFKQEEANQLPCTSKATIYTANIAAGLMISQMTKWMRNILLEQDFTFNILGTMLEFGNPVPLSEEGNTMAGSPTPTSTEEKVVTSTTEEKQPAHAEPAVA